MLRNLMRKYRWFSLPMMTAATLSLAACNNGMGPKETVGTLGGAALGGFAGSQIGKRGSSGNLAATAGLALLGAWLGNEIGKSLDRADRLAAERTAVEAFEYAPDGQRRTWQNPNKNVSGYTVPTRTYQSRDSNFEVCREYQTAIMVDGQRQVGKGTACRQPDGTWQIVD